MIKNILTFGLVIGAIAFWGKGLKAQFSGLNTSTIDKPVVVELFTSQSCSSCPPADRNLAALSKNPNVIALGFHVTYWNHLHWKDTLSREFSTQRQRSYAGAFRNGRVYTPQMIVNGEEEFVGSRSSSITSAINNAETLALITVRKSGDALDLELPEIQSGHYKLWIAGIKNKHTQEIPSGENRGRTVTYRNAVLDFQTGGAWNGDAETKTIKIKPNADVDRYVVLAQKLGYGAITAGGKTP